MSIIHETPRKMLTDRLIRHGDVLALLSGALPTTQRSTRTLSTPAFRDLLPQGPRPAVAPAATAGRGPWCRRSRNAGVDSVRVLRCVVGRAPLSKANTSP